MQLRKLTDEQIIELAQDYISTKDSSINFRSLGRKYGISKSTVHTYFSIELKKINYQLYTSVRNIIPFKRESANLKQRRKV